MNLLLLSIRGLRSFMCCELISALVVLLISIPLSLVLTIILRCTPCMIPIGVWKCVDDGRPIINCLIQCLAHRWIIPCVGVEESA